MLDCVLNRVDISKNTIPSCNCDDNDSDCPASLFEVVGIKISPLVIIQLKYDNTVA